MSAVKDPVRQRVKNSLDLAKPKTEALLVLVPVPSGATRGRRVIQFTTIQSRKAAAISRLPDTAEHGEEGFRAMSSGKDERWSEW